MCVGKNENDDLIYKYKIERGITNIKGGIEVLKQMKLIGSITGLPYCPISFAAADL